MAVIPVPVAGRSWSGTVFDSALVYSPIWAWDADAQCYHPVEAGHQGGGQCCIFCVKVEGKIVWDGAIEPVAVPVEAEARWNVLVFPVGISLTVEELLARNPSLASVWTWDPQRQRFTRGSGALAPGTAYWVFSLDRAVLQLGTIPH